MWCALCLGPCFPNRPSLRVFSTLALFGLPSLHLVLSLKNMDLRKFGKGVRKIWGEGVQCGEIFECGCLASILDRCG